MPDELYREAKARAAREGMSLSEFLLREVERALATPLTADAALGEVPGSTAVVEVRPTA